MTHPQRKEILDIWKKEYHNSPEQKRYQARDAAEAWEKGKGKGGALQPTDDGKGKSKVKGKSKENPYKNLVKKRQHSRWSRHLQRVAGTGAIAHVILFTGRADLEFLQNVFSEPPVPADEDRDEEEDQRLKNAVRDAEENKRLKNEAAVARYNLRWAKFISSQIQDNHKTWDDFTQADIDLVYDLDSGELERIANNATLAHGSGTLRRGDDSMSIGGSTGGRVRVYLDNWTPPNPQEFLRRREDP